MAGTSKPQIVVVDDEEYICSIILESLAAEQYDVFAFSDPREALEHISSAPVDLVLTDLVMGAFSGDQILDTALEYHEDAIVLLMTAHPTVQTAISALKRGAYDFLVKPFKLEMLRATIKRGLNHQKVLRDNLRLNGQVEFLKVANTVTPTVDIDDYLRKVLQSCLTELTAEAAAIICVDPGNHEIVSRICEPGNQQYCRELLDESTIENNGSSKSSKPIIRSEKVLVDGREVSKMFVSKPIIINSRYNGVINLLILSRFGKITSGQLDVLTILANSAASAIASQRLYQQRQESYMEAILALANAIEARDPYTAGHTGRVTRLAKTLAQGLGWDEERIDNLEMGVTLHDIGKIGVPDSILNKPSRLTEEERQKMMRHPKVGLKIVRGIKLLKNAIPYIISHHERYDGTGYPKGLKGTDIPVEGRLLAVADTLDAIMSDRPYRSGARLEIAVGELVDNRGTQFDPELVDLFLDLMREGKIDFMELYDRDEDTSCLEQLSSTQKAPV